MPKIVKNVSAMSGSAIGSTCRGGGKTPPHGGVAVRNQRDEMPGRLGIRVEGLHPIFRRYIQPSRHVILVGYTGRP